MNLRTLKKLSKRAAPLLDALGDKREQFLSERSDENFHGAVIKERKHWSRSHCHPKWSDGWQQDGSLVFTTRSGRRVLMRPPTHPRKGTVMVGCLSCGYEPEWDEECSWSALVTQVLGHFVMWDGEDLVPTRAFHNPSEILQGARDIIKEMQIGKR